MNSVSERIDERRRHMIGAAAMGFAIAELGLTTAAKAASGGADQATVSATQATQNSFGAPKQIDAGVLNVGYAELGPADGAPVILLHGWPYDIHTYADPTPCWRRKAIV